MGGATLREVQRAFFVSFPIPGRGEVAGANAVPGCQLSGLVPTPRHHPARGTGAQARSVEMLCFPKSVKGSRAGVSRPLSHTPGPGQHVDVSAELRCVLGHLLRRGIVPRVYWLQRGPPGTQWWSQQQSHTRGQKQQEEAAVRGGHLRGKEQGNRGSTEPTCPAPSPSPISPSLGRRAKGYSDLTTPPPRACPGEHDGPSREQRSRRSLARARAEQKSVAEKVGPWGKRHRTHDIQGLVALKRQVRGGSWSRGAAGK